MGHSQADKAASRVRILAAATAQMRAGGLDSVSVGNVMRSADMTHGGFYNHFGSRAELLTEALACALDQSETLRPGIEETRADPEALRRFVRAYLSRAHRDNRDSGCAIAGLAAEVGRAEPEFHEVMNDHIEQFIALVANALGEGREEAAMLAVSAMVGALQLSRVLTDTKRSDFLLKAVRDALGILVDIRE